MAAISDACVDTPINQFVKNDYFALYLCVHGLIYIAHCGLVLFGVFYDVGKDVVVATIFSTVGDLVQRVLCENHL